MKAREKHNRQLDMLQKGREHLIDSYKVLEVSHQDFKNLLKELNEYIDQITAAIEAKKGNKQ